MMEGLGFRPYEAYKDSQASWLGEVPADWQVGPGRICVYENKDKNTGMKESTVLSLSYGRVIVKDEDKMTGLVPESYETYQIVQPGDIIIRGTDLQNDVTSLRTGLAKDHGIITSAYINLRPKPNAYAEFLHYLLHSYDVKKVFYGLGSGLRQNLSYVDFKYLTIPLPSLPEQRAIVAFLDEKCAKIDGAVKIKEDQIALLRERRQILIQEAVTRGLNPAAAMKDSGIDWIGQIPAHWEVMRLKHISKIRYGLGQPPKESDDGLPLLRATNVERGKINPANLIRVDPADVPTGRDAFLKAGEIIVVRSGAYTGDSAIVPSEYDGSVAGYDMVVSASGVDCHFLALALLTPYVLFEQLYLLRMRAAQPHLNKEELSETVILVPPPQEQHLIADRMRIESNKIEAGIAIKERQIAVLKEYKTSLINAAVTGKIKVI